jgi:hypothetical protein
MIVMQNGIYWLEFQSLGYAGFGLIVVKDGSLNGGDSGYFYAGKYSLEENVVSIRVRVTRHNPAWITVFGPVEQFDLELSGEASPNQFVVSGKMPTMPNLTIRVIGKRLGDVS